MFFYFIFIVRVLEVKRERLFFGCIFEVDKVELIERELYVFIMYFFILIVL